MGYGCSWVAASFYDHAIAHLLPKNSKGEPRSTDSPNYTAHNMGARLVRGKKQKRRLLQHHAHLSKGLAQFIDCLSQCLGVICGQFGIQFIVITTHLVLGKERINGSKFLG